MPSSSPPSLVDSLRKKFSSAAERLDELESRRASYEALARRLFTLPQRPRRDGLIPVGPRLYLPGQVTDTNRITVLLGDGGDAAYFAERSAFQARGIVQRRLTRIADRVAEVQSELDEEATDVQAENHGTVEEGMSSGDQGSEVSEEVTKQVQEETNDWNDNVPGEKIEFSGEGVKKVLKKRVSFSKPLVTCVGVAASPSKSAKKSSKAWQRVLEQARTEHENFLKKEQELKQKSKGKDVKKAFDEAIDTARTSASSSQGGNVLEFFEEGDGKEVLVNGKLGEAEMTDEELLDITGAASSIGSASSNDSGGTLSWGSVDSGTTFVGSLNSEDSADLPPSREEYMQVLIDAEREEAESMKKAQMKEERKEREKAKKQEKSFGAGFKKGFLGQVDKKEKKSSAKGSPSGHSKEKRSVSNEPAPVQERIVERQVERKGKNSRRKRKDRTSKEANEKAMYMKAWAMQEEQEDLAGPSVQNESDAPDNPPVSKFRQMRMMQRNEGRHSA